MRVRVSPGFQIYLLHENAVRTVYDLACAETIKEKSIGRGISYRKCILFQCRQYFLRYLATGTRHALRMHQVLVG